jgi:hypothetical protein
MAINRINCYHTRYGNTFIKEKYSEILIEKFPLHDRHLTIAKTGEIPYNGVRYL